MNRPRGFVAYPSQPPSLKETIEDAVRKINESGTVELYPWSSMSISGKPIIAEICRQIDASKLFIADITNQNPNVLFELGYSIARQKRVWLLQDSSSDKSRNRFVDVGLLGPLGHRSYTNVDHIVDGFWQDSPHEDASDTPYVHLIKPALAQPTHRADLLYLRSHTATEASNKLARAVNRSGIRAVIDDPSEKSREPISWYMTQVCATRAVVAHLDSDNVSAAAATNAKYAFVVGLAYGMGKDVLLLAHEPYTCPIDYQLLMHTHDTAAKCVKHADDWLQEFKSRIRDRDEDERSYHARIGERQFLASLSLGEHVAENEAEALQEYFVQTGPYLEALNARLCLFIGRKGTGKTANLYNIAQVHQGDKRNHVCVVKPPVYDTEAVLNRLKNIRSRAEMGGVYESLWKYLIYSELCISVHASFSERAASLTTEEQRFIHFCESERLVEDTDFSVRLTRRVEEIEQDVMRRWDGNNPVRLAEYLHTSLISRMRQELGKVLGGKNRVVILIDNLDKAWKPRDDIEELCDLILGLLVVMSGISVDFGKSEHWRDPIPLSLVAFLRSDIYSHLVRYAREPDKIKMVRISWDDTDLLLRVIAERLVYSNANLTEDDVWQRVFPCEADGKSGREYTIDSIYPRPRDAIVFAKSALSYAVSRGHESIYADDLRAARRDYSEYALSSLAAEDVEGLARIETGTYALVGLQQVMSEGDLAQALRNDGVPDEQHTELIKAMCRTSVLGVEIAADQFDYIYDDTQAAVALKLASVYAQSVGARRFKVHPALCPALAIKV